MNFNYALCYGAWINIIATIRALLEQHAKTTPWKTQRMNCTTK